VTDNLFPGFDDYMAERDTGSQQSYELKILKAIYKALWTEDAFKEAKREAGEDFGLDWFNDTGALTLVLFAKRKIVVNPAHVLSTAGFTKTQLWTEYFDVKNRFEKGRAVAMFFPIVRMSNFVIHNASFLSVAPGCNTVIRHGKSADTMLRVEPARAFLSVLADRFGS
jgi:hypothetical protein